MTRINSIRMVLAIVALRNLEVHQMDVKTAFLNGDLDEDTWSNLRVLYLKDKKRKSAG